MNAEKLKFQTTVKMTVVHLGRKTSKSYNDNVTTIKTCRKTQLLAKVIKAEI